MRFKPFALNFDTHLLTAFGNKEICTIVCRLKSRFNLEPIPAGTSVAESHFTLGLAVEFANIHRIAEKKQLNGAVLKPLESASRKPVEVSFLGIEQAIRETMIDFVDDNDNVHPHPGEIRSIRVVLNTQWAMESRSAVISSSARLEPFDVYLALEIYPVQKDCKGSLKSRSFFQQLEKKAAQLPAYLRGRGFLQLEQNRNEVFHGFEIGVFVCPLINQKILHLSSYREPCPPSRKRYGG